MSSVQEDYCSSAPSPSSKLFCKVLYITKARPKIFWSQKLNRCECRQSWNGTEELPQAWEVQTVTSSILLRPHFVQFVFWRRSASLHEKQTPYSWPETYARSSRLISYPFVLLFFIFLAFLPCPPFSFLLYYFFLVSASLPQSFKETKLNEFFLCNQLYHYSQ
jgi:hypothetical protein